MTVNDRDGTISCSGNTANKQGKMLDFETVLCPPPALFKSRTIVNFSVW